MATSYTSLLGFALPVTGELDGTWGDVVNDNITELVEDAIAATATASVASGNWTLSTTGSGAANEARCAILIPTGSPGVSRNIIAPSQSKAYVVINQSDAAVVLKGSATTGTTIAAGDKAICAWNGSDFVTVASAATDGVSTISFGTTGLTPSTATSGAVTVAGTLAVANGGTGITSFGTGVATALGNNTNATGGFPTVDGTATLTNKTLTDPAIIGTVLEDVYTISDGAAFEIDPSNGSIQLITLGASRTPKATNFVAGESITLMVDDGSAYTITWTDATWGGSGVIWETDGGVAPTLSTTGYTTIVLWKVSTQVYGARVGDA